MFHVKHLISAQAAMQTKKQMRRVRSLLFLPAFTAGALRLGILIAETFCGFDELEGFRVSAEDS